jgi:radical SAM-linked protein
MRLATALALPVGTAGLAELIDIWLSDYVAPAHALYMLKSAAVPGIEPIACEYVAKDERSLQDTYVLADYTITLALGEHSVEDAQRALVSYVDGGVLTIMKKRREKSYDLKEQLITYGIEQSEGHRAVLTMTLKSLSTGAIRPEWLLDAAFSETPGVRAESITRTALRADQTLTY